MTHPTISQKAVEAAARACYEHEPLERDDFVEIPWDGLGQGTRDRFMHKARATVTAALAVDGLVPQGWQEITDDSAPPRDVPLLLGWWRDWPERAWECSAGLYGSTKGGWIHGQATHWMPLPAAPTGTEG